MSRRASIAVVLLLLCLTAVGCSKPGNPDPPAPSTTPADPAPADPTPAEPPSSPSAAAACARVSQVPATRPHGITESFQVVTNGLCQTVLAAEGFSLRFALPGTVTEAAAKAALKVTGAQVERLDFQTYADEASLWLAIGAGSPGEEVVVRMTGPVGEAGSEIELGFVVRREPSPAATVEVQVNEGDWQPLPLGGTLAPEPLRLRVTFSAKVDRQRAEDRMQTAFRPAKDAITIYPYTLGWQGENVLLVEWAAPPPRIWFDLTGLADERGLTIRRGAFSCYTGIPPRLAVLDPDSGQEEVLGEGPVDIWGSSTSTDGRWAILTALQPDSAYALDLWLVETASGQMRKTDLTPPIAYNHHIWLEGHLVVPSIGKLQVWDLQSHTKQVYESQADFHTLLSPDQRYLAGFTIDASREDPQTFLAPASIIIHDLTTHTEQRFPDVATGAIPHSSAPPRIPMAWSDDGRAILFQEYRSTPGQPPSSRWMQLDIATGQVSPATPPPVQPTPAPRRNRAGWQYSSPGWGPITLTSPQGQERRFDHGLIVGWRADGELLLVRWPNYPFLRAPGI